MTNLPTILLITRGAKHMFRLFLSTLLFSFITNGHAALIADWQMDEAEWNGTPNEVIDSSGNNFSGTAVGTEVVQTGENSTSQGICGYGAFDKSNRQKIVVPYHSALNPDSFTVSLWTKVEGSSGTWRSPITSRRENRGATIRQGFNLYAGTNNRWQFWTGTGINSWDVLHGPRVRNNVWTHISFSFSRIRTVNGRHYGLKKLYLNGRLVAKKYGYYQPNPSAPLILGGGGVDGNAYFFDGSVSKVQLYNTPLSDRQIKNLSKRGVVACPNFNIDTPASTFNCVEKGADGITGKLFTKTTQQSFNFDVIALRNHHKIETNFAKHTDHTVNVELVNANSGDGTCSGYLPLAPDVSQAITFQALNAGVKTTGRMTSSTAYRAVKCRITDNTKNNPVVGCSTDSFAIRPINMTVQSNMTNQNSDNTPHKKAGESFRLTTLISRGYAGIPKIDNNKIIAHAGAVKPGEITGVFNAAIASGSNAKAEGQAFSYSEVGHFKLDAQGVYDDTFTAIDQPNDCANNFSNSVVSGKVGCKFGNTTATPYFGRFTPHHFDLLINQPVFVPACNNFSYLGQPIQFAPHKWDPVSGKNIAQVPVATAIAKNSAGDTTKNYQGDFFKLDPTSITPNYVEATNTVTKLYINPPTLSKQSEGETILSFAPQSTDILAITKSTPSAPFDAEIALSFSIIDSDNIVVAHVNGNPQTNPVSFGAPSTGNGIQFHDTSPTLNKTQRWGRLALTNAHGSELLPLTVPVYSEYFNGTFFVKNTEDNCTILNLANHFSISDSADVDCTLSTNTSPVSVGAGQVKATLSSATLVNGESSLVISDNSVLTNGPGSGNTGHVDITSQLTGLTWLRHDWDADSAYDNCPKARAAFGVYKGNNKQIYFREVY